VDYSISHHEQPAAVPWRTVAIAVGVVAAVELVILVVFGTALLIGPERGATGAKREQAASAEQASAKTHVAKPKAKMAAATARRTGPPPAAELPRRRVEVMVLNGNGVNGAAAAAALRISRRGYRIGPVANAPGSDYTRNVVMYRRGFEGEGVRLAHDLGVKIVGPLDGLRARDLHGAHAVFVVGA
jgi:hypothetical protein